MMRWQLTNNATVRRSHDVTIRVSNGFRASCHTGREAALEPARRGSSTPPSWQKCRQEASDDTPWSTHAIDGGGLYRVLGKLCLRKKIEPDSNGSPIWAGPRH